jgi:magnesium transporter
LTASRRFDGSIPTHVPKFIVDTLQGIDPQQGELLALEYHTQMGYFIERVISKRDLAQTLDVEPRDLRKVLSASQRRLISGVNVREKCIILHLEHVKAIIMSDRMFLFDHTRDARVKTFSLFLPSLLYEQRTTNGSATAVATANGVNGNLPFELRALEAVLIEVTESLDAMLKEMTPRMLELLHDLTVVQSTANLSALVSANDSLSSFDARVQSLRHALTELLNNDEDLAGLFLTEKRATQDHGEAEELVENYLMQVEETSERIAELQTRFRNVMSYIQIHFDSQRNRLMRMSLVVSLGALSCSTTATGAGLFGMNLMSGLESSPHAFYAVSGTLLSIGALLFSGSYMLYRRTKRLDVDFSDHITNFKHK